MGRDERRGSRSWWRKIWCHLYGCFQRVQRGARAALGDISMRQRSLNGFGGRKPAGCRLRYGMRRGRVFSWNWYRPLGLLSKVGRWTRVRFVAFALPRELVCTVTEYTSGPGELGSADVGGMAEDVVERVSDAEPVVRRSRRHARSQRVRLGEVEA
ncbi:hypothetical protein L226DRAFT_359822 [Lentinus tigrinus ALCF2SS1-7]|uniref:uncharacterized protein n=1 Tax=Lentinus tigrinus ALCF2SS1-7 TaxID=1328758 RepID=UPI001165FC10|nr:hypothetical protein L226DRAFT_359822 [Lentinus tigrinus ALCF2SS1-7]